MGEHTDKFMRGRPHQLRLYIYANLGAVALCVLDYFKYADALLTLGMLVILVVLINGFALWQQRHGLNAARRRDIEHEKVEADIEAARDARLRSPRP
jgi:hypothetical protein